MSSRSFGKVMVVEEKREGKYNGVPELWELDIEFADRGGAGEEGKGVEGLG